MRSLSPLPNSARFRCATRFAGGPGSAFSLIEVMITVAIVVVIMVAVLEIVTSIERSWKTTTADSFAAAQDAFASVTQSLATATLEPYQDYADSSGTFRAASTGTFVRDHLACRSDLAFVCGPTAGTTGLLTSCGRITTGCGVFFLAPDGYSQTQTGLDHLLNAKGYFIEFGNETDAPSFLSSSSQRWRWRLKEIRQPSESLQIYSVNSSAAWIQQLVASQKTTPILVENIIALIVLPERAVSDHGTALSQDFHYDSQDTANALTLHHLPPRLRVALMAIDEASAQVLAIKNGTNPPALVPATLFQKAAQLDADLASLDTTLSAQKIKHRLFQREILLNTSAWLNPATP